MILRATGTQCKIVDAIGHHVKINFLILKVIMVYRFKRDHFKTYLLQFTVDGAGGGSAWKFVRFGNLISSTINEYSILMHRRSNKVVKYTGMNQTMRKRYAYIRAKSTMRFPCLSSIRISEIQLQFSSFWFFALLICVLLIRGSWRQLLSTSHLHLHPRTWAGG